MAEAFTTDPDVRSVVRIVANREAEHWLAFEKHPGARLHADRAALRRGCEKLAHLSEYPAAILDRLLFLGYGEPVRDPFGGLFDDHSSIRRPVLCSAATSPRNATIIRRPRALTETLGSRERQSGEIGLPPGIALSAPTRRNRYVD